MENQLEETKRAGVLGGVAGILNAGGNAVVYTFDVSAGALKNLASVFKKVPDVSFGAFNKVVGGLGVAKTSEIKKFELKIKAYEKRIDKTYFEIGKAGAQTKDSESPLEPDHVKELISDVREYEKEIQRLNSRIHELKAKKAKGAERKKDRIRVAKETRAKAKVSDEQIIKVLGNVIEKAVRQGEFDSPSDKAIFDKIATDLLDSEMEIKTLAAAELGKVGNEAAVPILMEAARFNDPDLTSEIIGSLVNVGSSEAVPLFKERVVDPKYLVRIGCLRGLYKLAADDPDTNTMLIDALKDPHADVRRSAATFLGWKDCVEAVPAIVQCLRDKEAKVRKAAVSSLANIKDESSVPTLIRLLADKNLEIREKALDAVKVISGEEIEFDVRASDKELKKAVSDLRDWWRDKRLGRLDAVEVEAPAAEVEAEGVKERQAETDRSWEEEDSGEEKSAEPEGSILEVEEAVAEPGPEEPGPAFTVLEKDEFAEIKLMQKLKSELVAMCVDLGIECDDSLTKKEITQLILKENQ